MLIDLETNYLYTDEGILIKELHCPKKMQWTQLTPIEGEPNRNCDYCSTKIIDTAGLKDEELVQMARKDPNTCLAVRLDQANVKIL